jgi:hypothetical protein
VSANALTRRQGGEFVGFTQAPLRNLAGLVAHLDSAGFVALVRYRGFDWAVEQYVGLGAAHPWRWFASMDACVEKEAAGDRAKVLDRIAWTVRLNHACRSEATRQGCADRLMPVIQGAGPDDYLRCLDRMPWAADEPVLGVGSMCRRHTGGLDGILSCVDAIHRGLGSAPARLHLFGLKGDAALALRDHPRVASVDSQSYGVEARNAVRDANLGRVGQPDLFGAPERLRKTDAAVAVYAARWFKRQSAGLARDGGGAALAPALDLAQPAAAVCEFEARLLAAQETLRDLLAGGEAEWPDVHPAHAAAWAALDD